METMYFPKQVPYEFYFKLGFSRKKYNPPPSAKDTDGKFQGVEQKSLGFQEGTPNFEVRK